MTQAWKSKTLWANIAAAIALFIGMQFGYQVTAEEIAVFLAGINIILRFITKEPLEW